MAQAAASIDEYEVVRLDALGPYPSETDLPFLSKKSTEEISMPVNMVLAFVASAFATALLHPVDTVKARLQASSPASEAGQGSSDQTGPARRLVTWQSLYTGVFANLAREGPSNALYLAVFEQAKVTIFANPATRHFAHTAPVAALLLAGAIGDAAGCMLSMPAEIVKRRLQVMCLLLRVGLSRCWDVAVKRRCTSSFIDNWVKREHLSGSSLLRAGID